VKLSLIIVQLPFGKISFVRILKKKVMFFISIIRLNLGNLSLTVGSSCNVPVIETIGHS